MGAEPMRTCIGCRSCLPQSQLQRLALVDTELVIDRAAPGRGAWICPDSDCVVNAGARRAFSRAFGTRLADGLFADTLLGWLTKPTD